MLFAKNKLENDELVLLKRIQFKELTNDDIFNLLNETRKMEGVKHSHIVNLFNTFSYENKLYIAMRFYDGGDLTSYLNEVGVISEKEAKIYFKQLLDAVRYYHRKGIVHRNLSTYNILFSDTTKQNLVVGS